MKKEITTDENTGKVTINVDKTTNVTPTKKVQYTDDSKYKSTCQIIELGKR